MHPAVLLSVLILPSAEPEISVADLKRFPPKEEAQAACRLGDALVRWLIIQRRSLRMQQREYRRGTPEYEKLEEAGKELDHQLIEQGKPLAIWSALYLAWDGGASIAARPLKPERILKTRLESLKELRKLLGREAYRKGKVLPLAPWLQ